MKQKKSYSNIDIGKCESLMLPLDAIRRATSRNSTMLALTNFELHNKVHVFWEGEKDFQKFSKRTENIPKRSDRKSKKDGQELKRSENKFYVPRASRALEPSNSLSSGGCMYVFHCWSWDQKCSQPVKAVSSISDMPWGYIKLLFGTYLAFA